MESKVRCEVIHPLYNAMGQLGLSPKEAGMRPMSDGWPAELTASAFNRLDQYACSPDNSACCYAELIGSSEAASEVIVSTHCSYEQSVAVGHIYVRSTVMWPNNNNKSEL